MTEGKLKDMERFSTEGQRLRKERSREGMNGETSKPKTSGAKQINKLINDGQAAAAEVR